MMLLYQGAWAGALASAVPLAGSGLQALYCDRGQGR